ncbi:hypothetical protein DFS34DRAFT_648486 [Phlyctochytrium arcticum]|nr:hypothetical protein DFS34DRAFT_648486 [Phlyctochytrium arcticum]
MRNKVTATQAFWDILDATTGIQADPGSKSERSKTVKKERGKTAHVGKKNETGDTEEDDLLIDPWPHENLDWSNDIFKFQHLSKHHSLTRSTITQTFETLRLVQQKIARVDTSMAEFVNLKELSLTGNEIEGIEYLPTGLRVLHLNANSLRYCPVTTHLRDLQHLGLAYNSIANFNSQPVHLNEDEPRKDHFPERVYLLSDSLVSLDLSWNDFSHLNDLTNYLRLLPHLKILALVGNPITLLQRYRKHVVHYLPNLNVLDDEEVGREEREDANEAATEQIAPGTANQARIQFGVGTLTGFSIPPLPPPSNDDHPHPPDDFNFEIRLLMDKADKFTLITPPALAPATILPMEKTAKGAKKPVVEIPVEAPVNMIEYDFAKSCAFTVNKALRDAVAGIIEVMLVAKHIVFTNHLDTADGGPEDVLPDGTNRRLANIAQRQSIEEKPIGARRESGAKKPAGKGGKGKKGKDEGEVNWIPTVAEELQLGMVRLSLRELLEGERRIEGTYVIHPLLDPQPPSLLQIQLDTTQSIGTVDLSFHLNPNDDSEDSD